MIVCLAWAWLLLARQAASALVPLSRLPLRTRGPHIIGADGQRVRLYCVNWYGAYMSMRVNNGLNKQPRQEIAARIAELGFNCVRLPYGLDMIYDESLQVADPNASLAANPDLKGLSPFEVFDATLEALTDQGLLVILNNHVSGSGWCCGNNDGEGLWYTDEYPESVWMDHLALMTARYRNNSLVVGYDLRNELRPTVLGMPNWGSGDAALDWAMAAVKGAKRVLSENEDMLIIITGLNYGLFLCDVPRQPVHVTEPLLRGRTVYTAHEYDWVTFHTQIRGYIEDYMLAWCGFFLLLVLISFLLARQRQQGSYDEESRIVKFLNFCCCTDSNCGACQQCLPQPPGVCAEPDVFVGAIVMLLALFCIAITQTFVNKCDRDGLLLDIFTRALAALGFAASWLFWARAALKAFAARQRRILPPPLAVELPSPEAGNARDELGNARELAASTAQSQQSAQSRSHFSGTRLRYSCVIVLAVAAISWLVGLWAWYGRFEVYERELDARWGFLMNGQLDESASAPVWMGEFGTATNTLWWRHFIRYLREKEVDWAYWAFNGEKRTGEDETFGIVQQDSITVRHDWKMQDLQSLMGMDA